METMTRVSATVDAQVRTSQSTDPEYVTPGRIGRVDLKNACYSFWGVFGLVAEDIANTRRGGEVRALLESGRTARQVIADLYGIHLPRTDSSYYTSPAIEARALKRCIRFAETQLRRAVRAGSCTA